MPKLNKAEGLAWMLYNRIYKLTGQEVGASDDWVMIANFLCDWIAYQRKEIGRLEEQLEKKAS